MARAKMEYSREIGFSSRYTMRESVEDRLRQMTANLNIRTLGQTRATGRY